MAVLDSLHLEPGHEPGPMEPSCIEDGSYVVEEHAEVAYALNRDMLEHIIAEEDREAGRGVKSQGHAEKSQATVVTREEMLHFLERIELVVGKNDLVGLFHVDKFGDLYSTGR